MAACLTLTDFASFANSLSLVIPASTASLKFLMKKLKRIGIYYQSKEGDYEHLVFLSYSKWKEIFPGAKLRRFHHRKVLSIPIVTNLFIYKEPI